MKDSLQYPSERILETERVILRRFGPNDLDDLHQLHSDPRVMEFLVGKVRPTKEHSANDLKKYIEHQNEFGFGKWAVIHKATQQFMGRAGLVRIPNSDEIDLGYALHQAFWGMGYASEIAKALHEYATEKLKITNIVGLVKAGNDSSARILEKIDYHKSGNGNYFGENFEVYRFRNSQKKDFYNIDQRWLASYFEKEWFDMVNEQGRDKAYSAKFPKFPSSALYCEYHEELVKFLSKTLQNVPLKPTRLIEIGASLGRTFYEVAKTIDSVKIATLVEPSENFFNGSHKIFCEQGPVEFPVVYGYSGTSRVTLDNTAIQKMCASINTTRLNKSYSELSELPPHDLVICSHVIDQCEDPNHLVETLKKLTATGGALLLSCSYQWKKKYVDFSKGYITNINNLFNDAWTLLGETEIEYRVRSNERHWLSFQSHVVIYRKK